MVSKVQSIGLWGLEGFVAQVETDAHAAAERRLDIVGLPDAAIKEAKDRIFSAALNSGYRIPEASVITNLAPASIKKEGSAYDLPMLLGILSATGQIPVPSEKAAFIGELSLSGEIRPCTGIIASVIAAKEKGFEDIYVPEQNAPEGAVIQGINVYGVSSTRQLCEHIKGETEMHPTKTELSELLFRQRTGMSDFSAIVGQQSARRACEIAAAGGHNLLFIGPPGTGKSMLAKSIPSILPDMTFDEMIECSKIYSIAGKLDSENPLVMRRPFIKTNQNVSVAGLTGGGSVPGPGLISLAHNGVLFLDEIAEFQTRLLETLRQPLEDNTITVNRVKRTVTFPSSFMLVCAMNPCPCGNFGHPTARCTCTPQMVDRYMSRISGPLLDRIDLQVELPPVPVKEIKNAAPSESSEAIKKRVDAARKRQQQRFANMPFSCNAKMSPQAQKQLCHMSEKAVSLLNGIFDKMTLSMRAYDKIIRISQTIADLSGQDEILPEHISEAVYFRSLDKKYWNRNR